MTGSKRFISRRVASFEGGGRGTEEMYGFGKLCLFNQAWVEGKIAFG